MSKCDINISFDRPDRTYRGGETVRGNVRISVQENVNSKGIKLTHRWKTHGRGNSDPGPDETIQLAGPQLLTVGEQLEFPFAVTAATQPVTYRGQLIFIDHYIRVDVDVPWARNPSAEEEYILTPGAPPPQMTGQRDTPVSFKPTPTASTGWIAYTILGILATILLVVIAIFALFLLPLILIVAAFFWIRHKALASRLGIVEVSMPHRVVAPGEAWPVSIRFTPRKSFSINSITLRLEANESATSGSGTNKTTATHKVLSESHVIREGGPLAAGEMVDEKFSITFPETTAFSFDAPENKIKWNAEVRIDIPKFPDWKKAEDLQVVPIEFFGDQVNLPNAQPGAPSAIGGRTPVSSFVDETEQEREYEDQSAFRDDSTGESVAADSQFAVPGSIEELVAQLDSAGRNNSQRPEIIANASETPFEVSILIDRIVSSMGTMNTDERFSNGKTVTGTIEGTRQAIQIVTTEECNKELESYRRGDVWQTEINLLGWDTLYNRITAEQAD